MTGTTDASSTMLELTQRIAAPRELVFSYFTDPERYRAWMGVGAELEPREDGRYLVEVDGDAIVAEGRFEEVTPPERVVFTFGWRGHPAVPPGSTRVEVTLTEDGDHTIVTLVHSGLPDEAEVEAHGQGWINYLGRLAIAARGGDPGPEPTTLR